MLIKTQLLETLQQFPEKFTLDQLMDKLILIDKIERGNQQSEAGDTISDAEVDSEIQKWFR